MRLRLGGICGSDLHAIFLQPSPSLSALSSSPFVVGHENVADVIEVGGAVDGVRPGDRVVIDPQLPCATRGFAEPCQACAAGQYNRCHRFTEGILPPGLMMGATRGVGGSWGEVAVAHRSQVIPVPPSVSDEAALLVEPFACGLHAVLHAVPESPATVLVVGAGTIGLCTVAALRALRPQARVIVSAKHPHQVEAATSLGAREVVRPGDDRTFAALVGAKVLRPILGRPLLVGGADVTLECVGSGRSIADALRYTRDGGTVALVGLASLPRGVDWTPIWLHELTLVGAYTYGLEDVGARRVHTMHLAMELLAGGASDLARLVTHRFRLRDYRRALETAANRRRGAIKVAFDHRESRG